MFVNNKNYHELAVGWSRIADNLLINGKTAPTAFKLLLNINDRSTCNISHNSTYANYIKSIDVLIWDEISMSNKYAFDTVDRLF